jgi:pimeloyl-ACP methyl ester carboxylesterase
VIFELVEQTYQLPHLRLAGVVLRMTNTAEPSLPALKIIALHGWLDNAYSFLPLFEHWKAHPALFMSYSSVECIAVDFAGHGLSDWRPENGYYYYLESVRDIVHLADTLGWPQFTLLGHSLGAGVALVLAGLFPDRVEKLIALEGIGPHISFSADDWIQQTRQFFVQEKKRLQSLSQKADDSYNQETELKTPQKKKGYASVEEAVNARIKGNITGAIDEDAVRLLCRRGLMPVGQDWIWRTDPRLLWPSPMRFQEAHILALFRCITAPVLVVLAEGSHLMRQSYLAERLQSLPHQTYLTFSGDHHFHMSQALLAISTAILEFLPVSLNHSIEP